MYSNSIVNFQESMTILNAHMKKVWKLIVCSSCVYIYIYIYICMHMHVCVCVCLSLSLYIYICKPYLSICIHVSMYVYIFTHTHTYIYTCWNIKQHSIYPRGCPHGVMVKAMDYRIIVREFVLQSHYYVHFQTNTFEKGMNPLILPAMG